MDELPHDQSQHRLDRLQDGPLQFTSCSSIPLSVFDLSLHQIKTALEHIFRPDLGSRYESKKRVKAESRKIDSERQPGTVSEFSEVQ